MWNKVPEKQIASQIIKKVSAFFRIQGVINVQHLNYQLTHTTLKNVELLKHSKISKTAPMF